MNTKKPAVMDEGIVPRLTSDELTIIALRGRVALLENEKSQLIEAMRDVSQWAFNTGTHSSWQTRLNLAIAEVTR